VGDNYWVFDYFRNFGNQLKQLKIRFWFNYLEVIIHLRQIIREFDFPKRVREIWTSWRGYAKKVEGVDGNCLACWFFFVLFIRTVLAVLEIVGRFLFIVFFHLRF